tara:strand:+ start:421 stop:984 length:564 start_codon:yes stop_codon:yes gene_type:complete
LETQNTSKGRYWLTPEQKGLLRRELIHKGIDAKEYLIETLQNHILIEKGAYRNKQDYILEKNLYKKQIEYLLTNNSNKKISTISKYDVANYYFQLAKQFNKIAQNRDMSRNDLWKITKNNCILKGASKTYLRIYKYIFRGELIPSPNYVAKTLQKNSDLPSYLSIVYLGEMIDPNLNYAHEKIGKNN